MPYVSIHDYNLQRVIILEFSTQEVEDLEDFVLEKLGHKQFEFMEMETLNLSINPDLE